MSVQIIDLPSTKLEILKQGNLIRDKHNPTQIVLITGTNGFRSTCFEGIYLPSLRYSNGFSSEYEGWELYTGEVIIRNEPQDK